MSKRGKMKHKSMPGWLKGGILIFPVLVLVFLITGLVMSFSRPINLWDFVFNIVRIPTNLFNYLFEYYLSVSTVYSIPLLIINMLLSIIFWFIIGAIIGFIYSKFKLNKKNVKK